MHPVLRLTALHLVHLNSIRAALCTGRDGRPSECILYYAKRDVPHILNVIRMGKKSKAAFQREVELVDQVGWF